MTKAESFTPGPDLSRALRDAFGQFATGVTLVTTRWQGQPVAMVANSFASVSLDPPLVLWCPARAARRFVAFAEADSFAIHVLGADQQGVIARFARAEAGFDPAGFDMANGGVPLLDQCLARFECDTWARHDGGDHLILIGQVRRASFGQVQPPLVFHHGSYGTFAPQQ